MAQILREDHVGIAVDSLGSDEIRAGVQKLLVLLDDPEVRERCVDVAQRYFSLDEGVRRYRRIYESLECATGPAT